MVLINHYDPELPENINEVFSETDNLIGNLYNFGIDELRPYTDQIIHALDNIVSNQILSSKYRIMVIRSSDKLEYINRNNPSQAITFIGSDLDIMGFEGFGEQEEL